MEKLKPEITDTKTYIFWARNIKSGDNQGLIKCLYDAGAYFDKGGDGYGLTILGVTTECQEEEERWYLFVTAN